MYTEIIKIIEGALSSDKEKVMNYSKVLANNLMENGELALAKKINMLIENKKGSLTTLDSFATKPVDTESRFDIIEITRPQLTEDNLVLCESAKKTIENFIEGYKQRDLLIKADIDIPNALLLYGPPGCGKTTVANYVANKVRLPLLTARLDGLVSSLLGNTAKNIRKVFDYASNRECVLFLDEFDVIAKLRDDKNELGELKRVVNSLIQNIDSFNNNSILIAATNHQELLDNAIWRRFSTIVDLEKPKKEYIKTFLRIILTKKDNNFIKNVKKLDLLAEAFNGFSYSDIKTVVFNTIKENIIYKKNKLTSCNILKNIYYNKNHIINNENDFIRFLITNGATHKEINETLNIPIRKIQTISKSLNERNENE